MKKTKTLSLLFVACLFTLASCGNKNSQDGNQEDSKEVAEERNDEKFDDTNLEDDTEFAVKAADAGMLEVELGKLALTKASSAEVKKFAQSMVDDHSKANSELKTLAMQKQISLPDTISDKNQKKYNDIAEESGADFDKAYSELMVKDHKDVVDDFKKIADKGKDADIKSWAAGKVSALEHHLSMAQAMEDAVKNNKKNN